MKCTGPKTLDTAAVMAPAENTPFPLSHPASGQWKPLDKVTKKHTDLLWSEIPWPGGRPQRGTASSLGGWGPVHRPTLPGGRRETPGQGKVTADVLTLCRHDRRPLLRS